MRPRRDAVRDAIRLAAEEHFLAVGYRAASLELIARAAGFTKGAIYSNFTSKPALFLELLEARVESFADDVGSHVDGAGAHDDLVDVFAARLAHEIVAEAPWHRCVAEFSLEAARLPDVASVYARLRDRSQRDLAAWMRRAGAHLPTDRGRPLATALLAAVSGFALELGSRPGAVSEVDIARALRGIVAVFTDASAASDQVATRAAGGTWTSVSDTAREERP